MARQALPRRTLSPAFLTVVRASSVPNWQLAKSAGFPQPTQFSSFIHAVVVPVSPLTTSRLQVLAHLVGYDGPIFVEEEPVAEAAETRPRCTR